MQEDTSVHYYVCKLQDYKIFQLQNTNYFGDSVRSIKPK